LRSERDDIDVRYAAHSLISELFELAGVRADGLPQRLVGRRLAVMAATGSARTSRS
jgi:hypothetical protein